jgi:hypothetical protein
VPDLIVRGSIWLAIACFVAAHAGFRRAVSPGEQARWALPAYWIGFALALTHFLAAFSWHYGWSHARAVAVTAEQTARVFGINWGGGVWVNYAFLAAWLTDASVQTSRRRGGPSALPGWSGPSGPPTAGAQAPAYRGPDRRRRRVRVVLRAFFLIVIANGAIVFVAWPMNVVGTVMVAALIWAWRPAIRSV